MDFFLLFLACFAADLIVLPAARSISVGFLCLVVMITATPIGNGIIVDGGFDRLMLKRAWLFTGFPFLIASFAYTARKRQSTVSRVFATRP